MRELTMEEYNFVTGGDGVLDALEAFFSGGAAAGSAAVGGIVGGALTGGNPVGIVVGAAIAGGLESVGMMDQPISTYEPMVLLHTAHQY